MSVSHFRWATENGDYQLKCRIDLLSTSARLEIVASRTGGIQIQKYFTAVRNRVAQRRGPELSGSPSSPSTSPSCPPSCYAAVSASTSWDKWVCNLGDVEDLWHQACFLHRFDHWFWLFMDRFLYLAFVVGLAVLLWADDKKRCGSVVLVWGVVASKAQGPGRVASCNNAHDQQLYPPRS